MNEQQRKTTKNRRCKFYAACGQLATRSAKHSHLGEIAVCDRCYKTNEYIEIQPY
jgi:hypothetical protein